MHAHSPWWYRVRGLIFGLVYIGGFLGGSLWTLGGRSYEPMYAWIARQLSVEPRIILAVAASFMFACWALRALGASYLQADVVWNADVDTDALIVQGPYAHTRSPLYLGNICMAFGVGALATPLGFGIIVAGSIVFVLMLVRYETAELHARYGSLVDDYVRSVPALLPRMTPAKVQGTRIAPSLLQGLRSEIFTASLFLGMTILVLLGDRAFPAFNFLWIGGWIAQQIATWNRLPSAKPPEP